MERLGISRQFMDSDGGVETYIECETAMNETMRQVIYNAPYTGGKIGKYELLDNAYRSTGGFENGDYLIPHPSEKQSKYIRRQNMAYYPNYVKPTVDAHVNPIFRTMPSRSNMSSTYEMFVKDVDGNKTTLNRFMKRAAVRAKLHGAEFVVVDMENLANKSIITKKDVVDERLYPYVYLVKPAQVNDWAVDKFGRLIYFSYSIYSTNIDDKGNKQQETESWKWTDTKCVKCEHGIETVFDNPIGIIPIVPIYGAINDSDKLIPQSDMYAIAKTNLSIYQAVSELRERNRNQAFSILTFPLSKEDDYENSADPLVYGTSDCLLYDGESSSQAPSFITPPSGPSEVILAEINFMIKEIYRMANLQLVTGTQSNVSGLSKEWDNQNLFQTISELAQSLQDAEYKIANIFSLYMGESMDDISIAYNNQFGIADPTAVLTNATQALALNVCAAYNIEVKKQVVRDTLSGVDNSVIEEVLKNLDADPNARNPLDVVPKVVQV